MIELAGARGTTRLAFALTEARIGHLVALNWHRRRHDADATFDAQEGGGRQSVSGATGVKVDARHCSSVDVREARGAAIEHVTAQFC